MNTSDWDDEKQRRLDALRAQDEVGKLTPDEQTELAGLLAELDDNEWKQLQPTLTRMEKEHEAALAALARLETTQTDLAELATRQGQLTIRARTQLRELLAEHRALQADYRRLNIPLPTA